MLLRHAVGVRRPGSVNSNLASVEAASGSLQAFSVSSCAGCLYVDHENSQHVSIAYSAWETLCAYGMQVTNKECKE